MSDENKEAVVTALIVVAQTALVVLIAKWLQSPDSIRTARMRACKAIEQTAMRNAQGWANVADIAAKAYENSRASV